MSFIDWQPTASLRTLKERASLFADIREFFAQRDVLEVETQILSHGTITDVHLRPFTTQFAYSNTGKQETLYLQTSPEYAMKRLLCAYQTSIFQITKAFRHEGMGRYHNPEFSMLEWYRVGFDHLQLMEEVDALLQHILGTAPSDKMTYQAAFINHLGFDPLTATQQLLAEMLTKWEIDISSEYPIDRDGILQLLFSYHIEPKLGKDKPCFVYQFPVSQAALARINKDDPLTADRFEVYYKGAELANGFYELADVNEQQKRFDHDNRMRNTFRLEPAPIDERFVEALNSGLPDCSGVALGIDRLLMIKLGLNHIKEAIAFPVSVA